jgi:hypothetical protein
MVRFTVNGVTKTRSMETRHVVTTAEKIVEKKLGARLTLKAQRIL